MTQYPHIPSFQISGGLFNTHLYSLAPFGCPPSFKRLELTPSYHSPLPFFSSFLLKQQAKAKDSSCTPHCNFSFIHASSSVWPSRPQSHASCKAAILQWLQEHRGCHDTPHPEKIHSWLPCRWPPQTASAVHQQPSPTARKHHCSFQTHLRLRWTLASTSSVVETLSKNIYFPSYRASMANQFNLVNLWIWGLLRGAQVTLKQTYQWKATKWYFEELQNGSPTLPLTFLSIYSLQTRSLHEIRAEWYTTDRKCKRECP